MNLSTFNDAADNFDENFKLIINQIKELNPNAKIYVQTIYNPFIGVAGLEPFLPTADGIIRRMNAAIADAMPPEYVIDIYEEFKVDSLLYTLIDIFDIHPSKIGHIKIFEKLFDAVSNNITPALPLANPFADVNANHIYFDAILHTYVYGIMSGTGRDPMTFNPDAPLTRAMAAQLLANMSAADLSGYEVYRAADVDADAWYAPAVGWAVSKGYMGGVPFNPNAPVPMGELARIIMNYSSSIGLKAESKITEEYGGITANATRADAAYLIHRILNFDN
jgi:hypothetical protein